MKSEMCKDGKFENARIVRRCLGRAGVEPHQLEQGRQLPALRFARVALRGRSTIRARGAGATTILEHDTRVLNLVADGIASPPIAQLIRSVERAPTRRHEPTRRDAGSAELKVPPLSGYALAGSPPFGLGHVRLRIPIGQARREPILRGALLHGLNLLDRLVCRRWFGKLGNRQYVDKDPQNKQASDVQSAHELRPHNPKNGSIGAIGCPRIDCECDCTISARKFKLG